MIKANNGDKARDFVNVIYQTAMLTCGFDLEDPQSFALAVFDLMETSMKDMKKATT